MDNSVLKLQEIEELLADLAFSPKSQPPCDSHLLQQELRHINLELITWICSIALEVAQVRRELDLHYSCTQVS